MKFAIYSRKSKATDKGESIGNQAEMCRNYINANAPGEEHEFLIYEDEGFSGKNTKRPEFLRIMQIAAVFAQLERETIAERVQDNMLMLSYTGRWLGGKTPFGFSSERIFQNKELGIPLPSVRTYAPMRR